MYISEVAIHGFKSFAKKVRLQFGEGITAVVGPNGCGKTNIVDAVRWVLGEQKYRLLRGSRLDDIIFNGSDSKKPLNVCEVSLVVHNNKGILPVEYRDVEITRRAFRNGESQYMINRTPCRLKDIQDLLVDTGMGSDAYSVIELKMVEDILGEAGFDRRRMFEEAAGINKYKNQRKATLRKIDATRADLNRVDDIVGEVENKVQALRLQLKRYDRHAKVTEKLREREIELAYVRRHKIEQRLGPLKEKMEEIKKRVKANEQDEKNQENVFEGLAKTYLGQQDELNMLKKKLEGLSEEKEELTSRTLVLEEQTKSTVRTIQRLEIEKEENLKKIQSLKFNIDELTVEKEALNPRIEGKRSEYKRRKEELGSIENESSEVEEKLEYLNRRQFEQLKELNSLRASRERTGAALHEKQVLLEELEAKGGELESERVEVEKDQNKLTGRRGKTEKVVSRDRKKLEALDEKIGHLRSRRHDLTLEFHRIANQVESMESQLQFYREIIESKEGYPSGVRYVLNRPEDYSGVLGTVAELIEVDTQYNLAIAAALGHFAYSLVCGTRSEAWRIADELSREKRGKVTIIPLDKVKVGMGDPPAVPQADGVVGPATEMVRAEKEIEPLVRLLLGDVIVVKDSKAAEAVWNTGGFTGSLADLEGGFYQKSGVVGSINGEKEIGVVGRKEKISELDSAIDRLVKKGNVVQEKTKKIDRELAECEEVHHRLSEELGSHIDALADIEKEVTRNEYTISQRIESLQSLTHQIVKTRDDILKLERSLDQNLPRIGEEEEKQDNYREKISLAKSKLDEVKEQRAVENSAVQDMRFDLISLENERDNLDHKIQAAVESVEELEKREGELSKEISQLKNRLKKLKSEAGEAELSLKKVKAQYRKEVSVEDLKEESVDEIRDLMDRLQHELRTGQKEREKIGDESKRNELQLADYESQIDLIESRIREKYKTEIPDLLDPKTSEDDLSLEIDRIERSIERIGPINMAVKQEFEEEKYRLDFLMTQRDDLVESERSLLESMDRIDSTAREQFLETFGEIRKNYKRTFRLFFDGGDANLTLVGEDVDPLEADIAILAKPPGKRSHSLRALSSGEKALTAIALLFSIYQVKPSPFCILDEVDAPLDDTNVDRFTRVLDKFAEETQFIIVTHNKLTMESAAHLYGVTMEQSGISKIVSVKLD